jgi:hypothetical protein
VGSVSPVAPAVPPEHVPEVTHGPKFAWPE